MFNWGSNYVLISKVLACNSRIIIIIRHDFIRFGVNGGV